MTWNDAIERQRQPLLVIIARLYTMIGLTEGGSIARLARPLYRAVLALLRPAESAVRRLIIVMAQEIKVTPSASANPARKQPAGSRNGKSQGHSRRSFALCDPRLKEGGFARRKPQGPGPQPRLHFYDDGWR